MFSIIGSAWTATVKELLEHYAQREASYPVLKQVILENLKRTRTEKIDEHNKVELIVYFSLQIISMKNRFYSMMKKSSKKWLILNVVH